MWAVSLTDFVQAVVIITGLVLVLLLLYSALPNGLGPVLAKQPEGFFSLVPKDYSWQGSMQYFLAWITVGWGSIPQQDVFQRTMSARTEGIAVRSVYFAAFLYLTLTMLPLFIGLLGNELYPEILANSPDKEAAQMLLPKIVLQHSPVWVQILFFGAIISAIMSTTSGAILSPATLVVENLIRPRRPNLGDRQMLSLLRWTVLGVTAISVWMALSGSTIYELAASSSTSILVTLFVPLVAGVYWPRAGERAVLVSMFSGFLVYYGQDWLWADCPVSAALSGLMASGLGVVFFCGRKGEERF
jgi:Na+/proline symporter